MKQDINKLFNDLADEGTQIRQPVDILVKIARLKKILVNRGNIQSQRDDLIRTIAALLGLDDDPRFRDFMSKE